MEICKWLIVSSFWVYSIQSVEVADYSGVNGGASDPDAFVKYCSMYTEPTKITRRTLENLHLSVMGKDGIVTPYNYYNVKDIPNHPDIDFRKKTFVFIGSYMDATTFPIGDTMAKQYNQLGYNSFLLHHMDSHWKHFLIPAAVRVMRPVSRHAAEMLANLTTLGLDPKKLELVGWGFGGQTMSFIAKNYREITGRNISMLIGLDPSGPCFRTLGSNDRLDPSDADFVLSIVTNMDGHGIATPVGHVTFYVNGGEYQPGDIWFLPCDAICSHVRAYFLWLAALLSPGKLIGMKCDTIQQARQLECYDRRPMVTNTMDMRVDKNRTGIFYVATSNRYPYVLGKTGLRKKYNVVLKHLLIINDADVLTI